MMKLLLSLFSLVLFSFGVFANISIEGHFQGKNLFIQNPEDDLGLGYCISNATVNGEPVPGGIGVSAFEIDFANDFNVKVGEHVFIVLEHEEGCRPKILNPEVLLPKSTFSVTKMNITPEGAVSWTTTGEQGKLPFVIEQLRWAKWVNVGEVNGIGTAGENEYLYELTPHSGENKIRVVQVDHSGRKRTSDAITFQSNVSEVKSPTGKVKDEIKFSGETRFEIYDAYGKIVKKGIGTIVNVTNLKKGAYYVNFDNSTVKIFKN
jgi:hypothetical protein